MTQINGKDMEDKLYVSVIISTYNRARYIGITLDSFLKQSYPADLYEILVCDNNSTDNTKEIIESYVNKKNCDKIVYLFEERQGMHYARNFAAKHAKGELLYFADDDVIADVDLLSELVKAFRNEKVGCATGRILPKWETPPPKWVKKYCCNAILSLNDLGKRTRIRNYDLGVFGCHEAVRKDVFFKAGGVHPDLIGNTPGVGDGETGLNNDIKAMGYYFAYVGTSVTYHMISGGRMTQKYLNKRFEYNGNSASYSDYRKKAFTAKELPKRIGLYLYQLILAEKRVIGQTLQRNNSLRFCIAEFYFYIARIKYDIKIIHDKSFKDFVENNDWF